MGFFSTRPQKTGWVSTRYPLFLWRFSGMIACLLSLTFIVTCVPVLPAQAATRSHLGSPINAQALRQKLKQSIRVTHTHRLHPSTTPTPRHANSSSVYNNIAISDNQNTLVGNFDGAGNSYSAQSLQTLGLVPGLPVTTNTITYTWPNVASGVADNYQAAGQVFSVPPISDAATVGFLGSATNGDSQGTATLTFTDGTTQTFTLGLTDWTLGGGQQSQPSFGNVIVQAALPVRNTSITQQSVSTYLFTAQQSIPAGETLQSVTLPSTVTGGQLHVFAVGLSGPASNNIAISNDNSTTTANFDTQGNSYSSQALQSVGITSGEQIASDDIAYTWPTANDGTLDNYQANGQILPVTPVANATTLGFLGSATNGATSGTATLTYTDGTTQTFTLGLSDWATQQPSFGNTPVATMTYLNTKTGKRTLTVFLFTAEVSLVQGETLQSVTLPTTVTGGQLHVFAIATRSVLNNVGSSLDSATGSGNYDNQHNSFSIQALQAAGITPGQPFLFNGVSFPWPQSDGITDDNYQATGQTLPITPVTNATTLAFIGSATNGATSGTATLTYTDGTTQTFTLGFADWTVNPTSSLPYGNQIAATMSSINTSTGTRSISISLLYAEVTLQTNKTLQSVTLPTTVSGGQLHVFAIATRSAYDNIGISDDNNPLDANFDGGGSSYSAQDFADPNGPGWNPGDTLTYQGINYVWPNVPMGQSDNYVANGQTIPVTPVAGATTIGFVGSADHAYPSSSGTATLTYTDGTTSTFTLGMTDWLMDSGSATPLASNHLFAALPHINAPQGQRAVISYLFEMETSVNASKTLQSVTLPSTVNQGNLHVFMIGTRASTNVMNNVGISDDNNTAFANFDGGGYSYSTEALAKASLVSGQTFSYHGIDFLWPNSFSVAPDNYQATGQVLPITPVAGATTLGFLGSATNQASSGTATLTYTDGSTQIFTLGFADWAAYTASSLPFGNQIVATMTYRNGAAGQQTGTLALFETEVTLQANKTLQSVTLPTTTTPGAVHVFTVGTRSDTYNNAGTSDDANPTYGNFDGTGNSYSAQALTIAGFTPGQTTTINGVAFTWPNGNAGSYNNDQAAGQTIPVTPVANANTLAFLGSAANGATSGTATMTYTDGTTQTFTLGFADWNVLPSGSLPFGDQIVATMAYRNMQSGRGTIATYLFETEVALQTGKTIQSVTLPSTVTPGQLHVFSVGTRGGALNNAGVSTDTHPLFSNFDGRGNSYSAQALSSAGFTPGRTVKVHGITFIWPKAAPGQSNNYLAARQRIVLAPRAGAKTLAFLGAATHGSASGTVIITYTDGTTQTFQLGFADWTTSSTHAFPYDNTVAVMMPYHNSPTGKQKLTTFVFEASVHLRAGKTVQSVTLPNFSTQQQVHVFAIGLQ